MQADGRVAPRILSPEELIVEDMQRRRRTGPADRGPQGGDGRVSLLAVLDSKRTLAAEAKRGKRPAVRSGPPSR